MRSLRQSGQGLEVVRESMLKDKYALSERLAKAKAARWAHSQRQVDTYQVEGQNLTPPRSLLPSNIVPDIVEKQDRRQRSFGLVTIVVLVIVAFLLGGGLGGGIAGSMAAREKSKPSVITSTSTIMPTATVTSPPVTTTVIQDAALCPLIHNTLYNSTVAEKSFLQVCETNLLAPDGQSIDIKNETIGAFEPCLDFCANTDGCVAASWVMFSADDPIQNSVCFLKSSVGNQTRVSSIGRVASGYLQPLPS